MGWGSASAFPGAAAPGPELVWYHFRFWRDDGTGCVLDKTGYRSDGQVDPWQLTVYQETTPSLAFVVYQIFPDRFCRLPDDQADPRVLWAAVGSIRIGWIRRNGPDPDGEIRNRDFFGGSPLGDCFQTAPSGGPGVTTLYLNPIFESGFQSPLQHR